jgi:hypothetical protein
MSGGGGSWSNFVTESDREAGVGIVVSGGNLFRDFTVPILNALDGARITAQRHSHNGLSPTPRGVVWFFRQMNHYGPWDIKRRYSWNDTIAPGTFPGGGVQFYFSGMMMTPDDLGNFTFGYIGTAVGFSLPTLVVGSVFAEITSTTPAGWQAEIEDWGFIEAGFHFFWQRNNRRL